MQFDDRLATVLRMQAGSERAAGTQYRQLLDLVGSAPAGADGELLEDAYARLVVLSHEISDELRARIVAEQGLRLRNPELVVFLAGFDLPTAAAALNAARLEERQWNALVPALPGPLRALLRHRRDLPNATLKLLGDLGIGDLGLPEPAASAAPEIDGEVLELAEPVEAAEEILELDPALELAEDDNGGIGALVRRIEAFRAARKPPPPALPADSPLLPLGEEPFVPGRSIHAFDFTTDAEGRIDWADAALAPMVVGTALAHEFPGAPTTADDTMVSAMRYRQPIRAARVVLAGAPAIAGEWQVDAVPGFTVPAGRFTGYRGRMRRPAENPAAPALPSVPGADSASDRIRQMIHELRTPVNAIQGFAEIIQQQVFGPAPNEYRALAATIAGDAARMLAGFEELDRLARLESGAMELERGASDFRAIAIQTARQLDGVLRPRSGGMELEAPLVPCPVTLARHDAELLAWRLLATLAGAVSPGEALRLALADLPGRVRLKIDLPAAIADRDDVFDSFAPARSQAVMAGMFGAGFTLRLARAEARAAGGDLVRERDYLLLSLPRAGSLPAENNRKAVD